MTAAAALPQPRPSKEADVAPQRSPDLKVLHGGGGKDAPHGPRRGGIGRRVAAIGAVAVIAAAGAVAGFNAFVNRGATVNPDATRTPDATRSFEPSPSASGTLAPTESPSPIATATPQATPKESTIPADAIRLDQLMARPVRDVSNRELEAALAKVQGFRKGEAGLKMIPLCENGFIVDRLTYCERLIDSLFLKKYHLNDPNAQAAYEVTYDYTVAFLQKAQNKPLGRIDLDLALLQYLQADGIPYFFR